MNCLHIDLLQLILQHAITPSTLRVCREWRTVIKNIPLVVLRPILGDTMKAAKTPSDIAQIPASLFSALTQGHLVRVPNILLMGTERLILTGLRVNIRWCHIVSYTPWLVYADHLIPILEADKADRKCPKREYFCHVFTTFEQFRRFILPLLFNDYVRRSKYGGGPYSSSKDLKDSAICLWEDHCCKHTYILSLIDDDIKSLTKWRQSPQYYTW